MKGMKNMRPSAFRASVDSSVEMHNIIRTYLQSAFHGSPHVQAGLYKVGADDALCEKYAKCLGCLERDVDDNIHDLVGLYGDAVHVTLQDEDRTLRFAAEEQKVWVNLTKETHLYGVAIGLECLLDNREKLSLLWDIFRDPHNPFIMDCQMQINGRWIPCKLQELIDRTMGNAVTLV